MSKEEALQVWKDSWKRIILSQLAPTFLLITTIGLLQFGLAQSGVYIRLAASLILMASGILGAIVQFSSATEAMGVTSILGYSSRTLLLQAVRFVTPTIFVFIYLLINIALFI